MQPFSCSIDGGQREAPSVRPLLDVYPDLTAPVLLPRKAVTDAIRLNAHTVARKCACRAWIQAPENLSPKTQTKVRKHQRSEEHRAWNLADWQEANTAKVDVPIAKLKKVG